MLTHRSTHNVRQLVDRIETGAMTDHVFPPQQFPQQSYPPQPPPKKKHTLRNIILIFLAVCALGFVGCSVLLVAAVDEFDKSIKASEKKDAAPGGPDNPLKIGEGKAFEVSGFNYQSGWKVQEDVLGSVEIAGLKVENNREDKDLALVEIKFMKDNEVLAVVDCSTESIAVGQTTSVTCVSADGLPSDYTAITINDTF